MKTKTFETGQTVWLREKFGISYFVSTGTYLRRNNGDRGLCPHVVLNSRNVETYYADHEVFTAEEYAALQLAA